MKKPGGCLRRRPAFVLHHFYYNYSLSRGYYYCTAVATTHCFYYCTETATASLLLTATALLPLLQHRDGIGRRTILLVIDRKHRAAI